MEVWALKVRYIPVSLENLLKQWITGEESTLSNGNLGYCSCSCCCCRPMVVLSSTQVCLKLGPSDGSPQLSRHSPLGERAQTRWWERTALKLKFSLLCYTSAACSFSASLCNSSMPPYVFSWGNPRPSLLRFGRAKPTAPRGLPSSWDQDLPVMDLSIQNSPHLCSILCLVSFALSNAGL